MLTHGDLCVFIFKESLFEIINSNLISHNIIATYDVVAQITGSSVIRNRVFVTFEPVSSEPRPQTLRSGGRFLGRRVPLLSLMAGLELGCWACESLLLRLKE